MSTLFFNNKVIFLIKRVLAEASILSKSYVGCKHFIGKSTSFILLANFLQELLVRGVIEYAPVPNPPVISQTANCFGQCTVK